MFDRSIAPPFSRNVQFDLITPDVQILSNGIRTFFVSGGNQDVLKIELIFEAGRWVERELGVAFFTGQLLSKGTKQKSSFEIARIFDQYGAHLDISPGLDFVSVSLYAVRKNIDVVLDLLIEILTQPSFPEKEFEQAKSIFVQNLQINNEKTSYVASQVFRKNLFGDHHPYGVIVKESHPGRLKVDHLRQHFTTFYSSPNVFVSGKVTPDDRTRIINHLERYATGPSAATPGHLIQDGPQHEYVERKESVQTSIRIGKRSVLRSHAEYVQILFVSHILGGYFGSRLMKNIREEKGLTYGISASIHGMKHGSYLIIGADVNKENTELTFSEIRKELKELRTTMISDDELETSRNHFIGSLQSEITTPFAHADKIKTIALYTLRSDHYQNLIRVVDAITPSQIADISERYYHEDTFVTVAVG